MIPASIDFEREDLATAPAESGYRAESKTLFLWEVVPRRPTEQAVRATFETLATAPAGAVICYVRPDFLDGSNLDDCRLPAADSLPGKASGASSST
ncbi:class I SAM-dependent methyltransferase [Nocardia aurantiaca]|uniref:Uncharacterized protein n=1 Tax=Nocardia aurantiaca TaxID=2675850 RepID=A0A6I3KUR3_9NOCA|nr:hypothetical protein [Nocardia aurantiaca]MTE12280.1 hypothetical protein [Nocardia aurantiaca]